ncbi:putative inosine-5`-monophosphate dehydrogenase protein [Fulvimarina pelagi HTCC2506]|uniref:Putative inosine-5`-monophosphate dehydrogenase protein n=2 Tax=Fulvimarina pelagi TaxID=217511 RepID=Q0G7X8_9HYPH|nr:CBS domain-containing protein [Fulvimarina pelagi]EAU42236.1 putative inosine-5`-monophosphate dehydrogenase protein [Fulvimarina pelagi HTCC2506]
MKIKDRPEFSSKPKPVTFSADTSVAEAVAEMSKRDIGSVVVVGPDEKVEGLVTERDVMKRLVNQGKDPKTTQLADIMTRELRMARADDDLLDWLRIMSNERFRRLPVIDADNRIVAIMTQGDFVSYTWPDLIYQATQVTKATVSSNYPILLIVAGILLYSLILIAILTAWGSGYSG